VWCEQINQMLDEIDRKLKDVHCEEAKAVMQVGECAYPRPHFVVRLRSSFPH
jgi:hypothetical protein